jgi:hypothetical protein
MFLNLMVAGGRSLLLQMRMFEITLGMLQDDNWISELNLSDKLHVLLF